jgi:hypothetical protein
MGIDWDDVARHYREQTEAVKHERVQIKVARRRLKAATITAIVAAICVVLAAIVFGLIGAWDMRNRPEPPQSGIEELLKRSSPVPAPPSPAPIAPPSDAAAIAP